MVCCCCCCTGKNKGNKVPSYRDQVITKQPGAGDKDIQGPGLNALAGIDVVCIQQVEYYLDIHRYVVYTKSGERLFTAAEESGCCLRRCCRPLHPFRMTIKDISGTDVLTLKRGCICLCCEKMVVEAPPRGVIGNVARKDKGCCLPHYLLRNESKEVLLRLTGPKCTCCCCGGRLNSQFKVMAPDGRTEMGSIFKEFVPLSSDPSLFTADDRYTVTFQPNMSIDMKGVVLATSLAVDYNFFEFQEDMNAVAQVI